MTHETVAVVIPVYNGAAVIERAIRSVLDQTVAVAEIIVVDDGSVDDTVAVVEQLADTNPNITLIRQPQNGGVSKARNTGFAHATADWIAILDADDAYRPNRIEELLKCAGDKPVDLVFDNMILHDLDAGVDFRTMMPRSLPDTTFDQIEYWKNCRVGGAQYSILKVMIRRQFIQATGLLYDADLNVGEDLIYYGEAMALGATALLTHRPYYVYSVRLGAVSGKRNKESRTQVNFAKIAQHVDALLDRRSNDIPPEARKQAIICRNSMLAMDRINSYREERDYDRIAAGFRLLTDPGALRLLLRKRRRQKVVRQPPYTFARSGDSDT